MLNRTITACLLALALNAPAAANKYHLADEKEAKDTVGNAEGRVIEGVLLQEDEKTLTIRIVGGEVTLAKADVKRVEKDDLTVAMIETQEKSRAAALAAAETRRREVQAAEASARRQASQAAPAKSVPAAEKSLLIEVDFQNLLPGYTFRTYDPVLDRANLTGLRQVIEDYLRVEVQKAAHR